MTTLAIAVALLWAAVIALAVIVFALSRQIGVLFERVAPMGALITDGGPKIGEASAPIEVAALDGRLVAVGRGDARAQLVFFLSPTCPVCKKLLPALKSAARAEKAWLDVILASDGDRPKHEEFVRRQGLEGFPYLLSTDLGLRFRVDRLPFAVLLDADGVVRAKGLVNNREQLESLFNAGEMGVHSIQKFLDAAPQGYA